MKKIILYGYIQVPEKDLEAVKSALPAHIAATRAEPGCMVFKVTEDLDDPCRFRVYEEFDSRVSFEKHQERVSKADWSRITQNVARDYSVEESSA